MIEVNKLCFSYTNKPFVENVSFHVGRGEIFGFLGKRQIRWWLEK